MKKIVSGEELRVKMEEAINLLCDTVKSTIGPKGSNVIIDHSTFSPFITNDGVTIAENIESEDAVINTILELAKEASLKTNDLVGDGTTTTLVILQSLFNEGLNLIRKGINPVMLKKELDNTLKEIVNLIERYSHIPSKEEMAYIASVSSNDEEIGKIISEVYLNILEKSAITIKESDEAFTKVNYLKGYIFESLIPSLYFLEGLNTKEYLNPYILLFNNKLDDIEILANILNYIIKNNSSLIIMAQDYSDDLINTILNLNLENHLNIMLLKIPEYGIRQNSILEDIGAISQSTITDSLEILQVNYLGKVEKAHINNEKVYLSFKFNDLIKERIIKLNEEVKNTETEQEFIKKRLAMFNNGVAEILVGAQTTTERREKKMRFDDALWAISSASKGVTSGGGLTLAYISSLLNNNDKGTNLLKKALLKPMEQILINAGLDYNKIFMKLKESNYKLLYNVKTDNYENITKTKVLDSKEVLISAVSNAVSIAGMILTTTSIVINEYQNNLNKVNDYNEL